MTVAGIPGTYYGGDELATTSNWARSGSDAALRPSMPAADPSRAGDAAQDLHLNPTAAPVTLDADHAPGGDVPPRGWLVRPG